MLPTTYLDKMKDLLKDEYDAYLDSFNNKAYKGLRVNTSKISVEDFLNKFPCHLKPVPWTSDGFYYEGDISKHPYYYAGLFYLQEPSAMLPAELLPIDEGDIVLDACAAPGGKSLKLLNKLNNTGLLISNDISASRSKALLRNIERWGFSNYFVISEDVKRLESKYKNTFNKILLDAPCSGEGMFRKEPSLIKSWEEKGNQYYSDIQKELIVTCLNMLKDGGMLLYSTCTFDKSEDEEIIQYALNNFDNLKLIDIKKHEGFKTGIGGIGVKLFPHLIKGEGHFACLIQKGENIKESKKILDYPTTQLSNLLLKEFNTNHLKTINDQLYCVPDFDTKGLRVLRSGLLLGQMKKQNFEPSQALSLNLKINEFKNVINFDINDVRVNKYLKGETINIDESYSGYVLVCVDHFPLGFGKALNGILKNKIDKGWIMQ